MSMIPHNNNDVIVIPLTKGLSCTVDCIDADFITRWKWKAHKIGSRYYAERSWEGSGGKTGTIPLHRLILERKLGRPLVKGEIAEHKDNDPLNNTRENLRVANKSQNNMNKKRASNNTSGYKGVCWNSRKSKWQSQIKVNRKCIFLGYFKNIEDAAKAYADASKLYHGEFGRIE